MKIGVLGAGAVGCYVGGRLVAAGHDVVLVGRLGPEIRAAGLELSDHAGARVSLPPARVRYEDDAAALAEVDAVLVTVKSMATEEAARPLARIVRRSAPVVSLQNGVSNAATLRSVLPEHVVLAGMVPFNVVRAAPGRFHNGTDGPLALESRGGVEAPLVAALRGAGFAVETRASLDALQWSKLVVNLNNAVNALAGVPLYDQIRDAGYRRVMALCAREGLAVVRAAGLRLEHIGRMRPELAPYVLALPGPLFLWVAARMVKVDRAARSSMLVDLELRRTTEVDHLNGAIVRLAASHGAPAPVNAALVAMIKEAEAARAGSPRLTASAMLARVTRAAART